MPKVLYKSNHSPPARAVMMVDSIIRLELDKRDLNPVLRDQDTPEMTAKNPMRTVPTYEEDGFCLADSHAIILYLLDQYGKPEHSYLLPQDKRKRAVVLQRMFFDCGILFERLRAVLRPAFTGRLTGLTMSLTKPMEDAYRILEAYLSETKYLADDVMTVADICAVATVATLDGLHAVDEKRFPNTKRWLNTMAAKKFCAEINEPGSRELVHLLNVTMENNKLNSKSKL